MTTREVSGSRSGGVSDLLVRQLDGRWRLLVATSLPAVSGRPCGTGHAACLENVLLKSTFPVLLPDRASCATAAACLVANARPSDRAMAARSGSRSTVEDELQLTKRCIEGQRKNTLQEQNIFLSSEKASA